MDKKLIEILSNIVHWDTCPEDYKLEIERVLKREQNKRTLSDRKEWFYNKIFESLEVYKSTMLDDFFDYWSEHNDNGYKMKFEMQKTFNIKLRLKQWYKRSTQYQPKSNKGVNSAW